MRKGSLCSLRSPCSLCSPCSSYSSYSSCSSYSSIYFYPFNLESLYADQIITAAVIQAALETSRGWLWPILFQGHWLLCIIRRRKVVDGFNIGLYDSKLGTKETNQVKYCYRLVSQWLPAEPTKRWVTLEVPEQKDDTSSGIHVIMHCLAIMRTADKKTKLGHRLYMDSDHVDYARRRILLALTSRLCAASP